MADPNRKINLDLTSSDPDESDDQEFGPEEISLVKEFEEEFKGRFTEDDQVFMDFCHQKPKSPPIIYPFDSHHHHHHRGGGGGGNRGYHNHRGGRGSYGHYRNNRGDNNYHQNNRHQNNYNRHRSSNNDDYRPPDHKQRRYNP
jgi:hypothetical protein